MGQKSQPFKFNEAWTFPEPVEKRIAKKVDKIGGLWLHAPVGISKIGTGEFGNNVDMITLDINDKTKPDIVCDIFKMTDNETIRKVMKTNGGFDGVISDPIWYTEEKNKTVGLSYPQRRYLSYQVRDVLKPNGIWIFNGLWLPFCKGLKVIEPKGIEVPAPEFSSFRNVSLLVYLRKMNHSIEVT